MQPAAKDIFISYARSDGHAFAEAFEQRLDAEAQITSWRDIREMESGTILPQVLRAIEEARHLVLILSRRALTSDWIKREWSHARTEGKRVSPVLADASIQKSELPPWIRREEVYDLAVPERWNRLVSVLLSDGKVARAPYMPGDLSEDFVPRPNEFEALKQAVLSAAPTKAVALTTALSGAGGYGKTTLANYLCRDADIRFEFTDGIVRVEIGKERDDVLGLVLDLIEKLAPEAKRPGFQDVVTASEHLGELIGESRLLLVIDDVWREAQLRHFLRGGPNCVRLVTTRLPHVLPSSCEPIHIDEMRAAEAASLISSHLLVEANPAARVRLTALADRLGHWAQMLAIANGWIRERARQGEKLPDAIARFDRLLTKKGLTAFDPKDKAQRSRAIRSCVEASLEDLGSTERQRLGELGILPEDEAIPLMVVEGLWNETGSLDEDETEELAQRLHRLSLLQALDLGQRTLRLHDNMAWYLRDSIAPDGCRAAHAAMVEALGRTCGSRWERLPHENAYDWRFLIRHLRGAERDAEADRLLTDYAWIKAKLAVSGAHNLLESYFMRRAGPGASRIGRAIALSVPALAANLRELPRQLFGRLGESELRLATAAQNDPDLSPAPRWPHLTPPGAQLLRLIGHEALVRTAVFSPDGTRIVTASDDATARIWETVVGREVRQIYVFPEPKSPNLLRAPVHCATFLYDGTHILAASGNVASIWNAFTGEQVCTLTGHEGSVQSAAFSPDGARIVTASQDKAARIWDRGTAEEICRLGHEREVLSAAFSPDPDGAFTVTASGDGKIRIWDNTTGSVIKVLTHPDHYSMRATFPPKVEALLAPL